MKFRSNTCVAIHLKSLAKAERFFSDVMGFKLKSKTRTSLEYDTGDLMLYINRSSQAQPPAEGGPLPDRGGPRKLALFPRSFRERL